LLEPLLQRRLPCPLATASRRAVGDDLNDDDSDGFTQCFDGSGFDCDETNPAVNEGAIEVCDDSIDNDCDGAIDAEDTDCDSDADSGTEADTDSGSGI
jgi:hypothetical protein